MRPLPEGSTLEAHGLAGEALEKGCALSPGALRSPHGRLRESWGGSGGLYPWLTRGVLLGRECPARSEETAKSYALVFCAVVGFGIAHGGAQACVAWEDMGLEWMMADGELLARWAAWMRTRVQVGFELGG